MCQTDLRAFLQGDSSAVVARDARSPCRVVHCDQTVPLDDCQGLLAGDIEAVVLHLGVEAVREFVSEVRTEKAYERVPRCSTNLGVEAIHVDVQHGAALHALLQI